MTLRMIDTFSGIGGFSLAARWLGGIETVQFVEREPYCRHILRKHWPDVPIHDDICTFNPAPGSADIVVGGFPCQDISTAGKQAGIKEGTRSGLFYELMRVVRLVGPRFVVLENVAAITSNGMDAVLGTLAEAGYDCEWACIKASDLGACHRRDRWWCVAYPQSGRRRTGPGQGTDQAGQERPGAGNGGSGSDAANATGKRCRKTGKLRPDQSTEWTASGGETAAYAERGGGEAERQRGQLEAAAAGALNHWAGSTDAAVRGGETAPHPHCHGLEGPHQLAGRRQEWPAAPQRLNPNWRSYLSKPVLCRGDDGLSGRVDRLKALGNAVVPQVAMVPLARVLQLATAVQP